VGTRLRSAGPNNQDYKGDRFAILTRHTNKGSSESIADFRMIHSTCLFKHIT
jgi:hypothetical protein